MGIFDNIFQAKPKAPEGAKYTLIIFDWDSFSHHQDFHFLEQYENPVLWFVSRNKWDNRWDVLKSKYSVTHLQVPAYERSLISFLICALMFEVGNNKVYKKVVIAAGHPYFKGTVSFLLEKKILAELYEVDPRFQKPERREHSERKDRNERTAERRNPRPSQSSDSDADFRNRPEKEETSFRKNERTQTEFSQRENPAPRAKEENRNRESNENRRTEEPQRRSFREHRNSAPESETFSEKTSRPAEKKNPPLQPSEPTEKKVSKFQRPQVNDSETDAETFNESPSYNDGSGRLPTPEDLQRIVNFFNENYPVDGVYLKSYFGMLIKQATGRTAPEVLGSKNARPFIEVLVRNHCIEQIDSQTFKVLKEVNTDMFQGGNRRRNPQPNGRNRNFKRRPRPETSAE